MGYIIGLARETFLINAGVRKGEWPKIRGISLSGKIVGLIGFGDIGKQTAKRALAANMKVIVYDPFSADPAGLDVRFAKWPNQVEEADFVVATCALTNSSRHMLNKEILQNRVKKGVRIVNVSRGPVIDEQALTEALHQGRVHSVALDVFEKEPLPKKSNLRSYPRAVFGSHNSSNTIDAVRRASIEAIKLIKLYLD